MNPTAKKTVGDHLRQVAAYSILLTVFSLGVGVCSVFWSSTVASLNQQIGQSRTELNRVTGELEQVKSNYFSYRTLHENGRTNLPETSQTDSLKVVHRDDKGLKQNAESSSSAEVKKIDRSKSAQFFNDDLTISLVAVDYDGDPLRYLVTANVTSTNGQVVRMKGRDVGGILDYVGSKRYRITILEAGTFSATFKVAIQK